MNLKKTIAVSMAAVALFSSALNVSAAEITSGNYVKALKADQKEELIINVDAYKAAYSDLEAAFGNDRDAYVKHYLTFGVYEGRTKGVLFDPLTYAAAYSDVKAACGDDIFAIVNHYVNYGVVENRTLGTAKGYDDIASAVKNGAWNPNIASNVNRAGSYYNYVVGSNAENAQTVINAGNVPVSADYTDVVANINFGGSTGDSGYKHASAENSYVNPAPSVDYSSSESSDNSSWYDHTTSIYTDDRSTLVRVEYYDENNNLIKYSDVTDYDSSTNSYTENIYSYDEEKGEVHERTDTYVNGSLSSSEEP